LRVRWRETRLREIPALVVEVADTGPGVAPGAREKLFLPFLTTKSRGTGLGLPTVAKLAAAHGGQVEYREEAGGGACFCVTLPRRAEGCFTGLGQAGAQHAD
jgi:signal transduction histidine kinase